ncbi:ATP-binding protein [Desulfobacula phenolica]|uniref:histidine kinase n=1 Tax=Desulfobacula phenolica TaxID=90732 RepID=A0A1H2IPU0_9BACT|nr:ATP-binding protein [Desulfobacula phenolica]SDU46031.1 two-component system, OmpR family, sensor histidine kinase CpxA [Desulfobacula phenolica]
MMSAQTKRFWPDLFLNNYLSGIIRKNLFFKILFFACSINFLSMGIALLVAFTSSTGPAARMKHREENRQQNLAQILYLYSTPLIERWALKGSTAAIIYANQLEKFLDFEPYVFNFEGHALINRKMPLEFEAILKRFRKEDNPVINTTTANGIVVMCRMVGPNGETYIVAGRQGRPKKILIFPPDFTIRIIISIIMLTLLSFLLARHITGPITKLRRATRKIATGDLGARVSETIGRRQDEIAQLGLDFDQMVSQIQNLIKDRQQLLRDISHELRSPLARLSIALEISRNKASEEVMPSLQRIDLEAERLNTLIGEILLLNRLEAGPNLRICKSVDVSELIHIIGEDANFEAQHRNVSVVIASSSVIKTHGYPEMLHRAIENVVRNAIRYTDEGTTVNISIETRNLEKDPIILTIKDHGPGVPSTSLPHLFKPFYRVEGDRGRKTGGTGVGLAIAYRAIKLHDGEIRAENSKAGGLKIIITIPKTMIAG